MREIKCEREQRRIAEKDERKKGEKKTRKLVLKKPDLLSEPTKEEKELLLKRSLKKVVVHAIAWRWMNLGAKIPSGCEVSHRDTDPNVLNLTVENHKVNLSRRRCQERNKIYGSTNNIFICDHFDSPCSFDPHAGEKKEDEREQERKIEKIKKEKKAKKEKKKWNMKKYLIEKDEEDKKDDDDNCNDNDNDYDEDDLEEIVDKKSMQ
ncbi:uncharacterized protein MONOS_11365 [Monocercomonoides exilis]|uniref:uncharacterized protein n=1 Tax=Monocercomonoides exilis TaxID=2049356 RepID=UPI00355A5C9A|nr:hypothetical protein MONOS_11365 [Monocercomonoides exilis]|eukprot:MONOS_11365.1-p1 / transcript=MONOS_11365.1 / gene=MONOS_11365 / organism=Monocercomonoides_exilis_PA203 / gene_product=unspecified product / transcript_product=unspecified product / location=Mono_scaffold00566:27583-28203(+) / protein_length=207 / sequence_SO=supercontig / SO=protein_coding / is_pseudo=false